MRDFARAEEVVADVQSTLGPIDVLVNNAGIKRDGALHNMDPAAWQEVIDTNLTGTFNYSRALMKQHDPARRQRREYHQRQRRHRAWRDRPITARRKPASSDSPRRWRKEVARFGVRVNAVAPGFIETDMTASIDENARKKLYAQIPMGKPGTPKQVARAALYLASDDAAYITGQV